VKVQESARGVGRDSRKEQPAVDASFFESLGKRKKVKVTIKGTKKKEEPTTPELLGEGLHEIPHREVKPFSHIEKRRRKAYKKKLQE